MRTREIQMEFDQFEDVENFHGTYVHETSTWGATGWVFHQDVADDIMSDWEHDTTNRSYERLHGIYVLSETDPAGRPVLGMWHPRRDSANGDPMYFLSDFPFKQTFRVTTDPPPAPKKVDVPTPEQFAAFGRSMAILLASSENWGSDLFSDFRFAEATLGVRLDDSMDEGTWLMWQKLAGTAGLEMPEFQGEE